MVDGASIITVLHIIVLLNIVLHNIVLAFEYSPHNTLKDHQKIMKVHSVVYWIHVQTAKIWEIKSPKWTADISNLLFTGGTSIITIQSMNHREVPLHYSLS